MEKDENQVILLDNKGLSLIELLVTVTISSFVLISVFSFMLAGSKSYANASAEMDLQSTRQLTMNFIADGIMSASREHIEMNPLNPAEGQAFTFSTVHDVVTDRTNNTIEQKGVTFYYDGDSSLYVYEANATLAQIQSNNINNLVSKNVDSIQFTLNKDDQGSIESVNVKAVFQVRGRTSTVDTVYKVRNK